MTLSKADIEICTCRWRQRFLGNKEPNMSAAAGSHAIVLHTWRWTQGRHILLPDLQPKCSGSGGGGAMFRSRASRWIGVRRAEANTDQPPAHRRVTNEGRYFVEMRVAVVGGSDTTGVVTAQPTTCNARRGGPRSSVLAGRRMKNRPVMDSEARRWNRRDLEPWSPLDSSNFETGASSRSASFCPCCSGRNIETRDRRVRRPRQAVRSRRVARA